LADHNLSEISELVRLFEEGFEITLQSERLEDGDWVITGEAVKEVIKGEDLGAAKSPYKGLAEMIASRSLKRDIPQNEKE